MRRVAVLIGLAVSAPACNSLLGIDDVSPEHDAAAADAPANAPDAPLIDAHVIDAPPGTPDASMIDASTMTDAGTPDAGGLTLTVKDYLSWCSVSVDGGAGLSTTPQTISVTAGSTASLTAMPLSGFQLGLWHHTDGDTGSGDPGTLSGTTSTATATIGSTSKCVWVCCPFVGGSGCPTADQCP